MKESDTTATKKFLNKSYMITYKTYNKDIRGDPKKQKGIAKYLLLS